MYNRVLGIHEVLIVVSSVSRSGASDEARLSVSIVISVSRSGASDEARLSVSIAAIPGFRNLPSGDGRVVRRCWVNFQCRGVLLI